MPRPSRVLVAVLLAAACSTDLPRTAEDTGPDFAPRPDAAVDAPADVARDAPAAEAASDLTPDLPGEPPVDAQLEAALDLPPPDVAPDGGPCPDGFCDMVMGEDDFNCPQDCGCVAAASCADLSPFGCACDVCSIFLGNNCLDADSVCSVPADPCGNGVCDYCETAGMCADC
jgi:hypothetical protein